MRLVRVVDADRIPGAIAAFIGIVREITWQKRIDNLRRQVSQNEFLRDLIEQEHVIEFAMGDVLQHYRSTGSFPSVIKTHGFFRLVSFVWPFLGAYYGSSPRAQKRLAGMLRSALKKEGFSSLEFELATAVHLSSQGFDVFFSDIETGSGNDFIATRGSIQFDIECKSISPDIGKRVHSKEFRVLANSIATALTGQNSPGGADLIFDICVPNRISASEDFGRQVVEDVQQALMSDCAETNGAVCSIKKHPFDIRQSPFWGADGPPSELSIEECQRFVNERLNLNNPSLFVCLSKKSRSTIVVIRSQESDTTIASLSNQLSSAAKTQLSQRRPAALFAYFRGLDDDDIIELKGSEGKHWADGTPIQRMATDLLIERPHLHTIAFVVPQTTKESSRDGDGPTYLSSGHTYTFVNPNDPNAGDSSFSLFPAGG